MDPTIDSPTLPDMVMCGDHPSFTKNELNAKEAEEKEAPALPLLPRPKPSTTQSFRERAQATATATATAARLRASSHVLRVRRVERGLGDLCVGAGARAQSAALVQAALGSFRWPPYLVAVWVCVLILTHALHCVVGCLERALPRLRAFCQYLRSSAECSWYVSPGRPATRVCPAALGALAAVSYAVYFILYVVYSVALWSIEPLADEVKADSTTRVTKVTDYTDGSEDSLK